MSRKTLLTFGDSNTHGTIPAEDLVSFERFGPETRWPTVAAAALGEGWHLVEEGLPGRTTQFPDPLMGDHMDGREGLKMALMSHARVDVLTIMLGTNDVKFRLGATPARIAAGIGALLDITRDAEMIARAGTPKVLVIAPPPVAVRGSRAAEWQHATEKSLALPMLYAELAAGYGVGFLDAGAHIAVDPEEGIHWTAATHRAFGAVVAEAVAAL